MISSCKTSYVIVFQGIGRDVERSLGLMLSQLLQQLRGSLQLPACLRVVGFLRRMEVFSDTELRLKFLQARGSWLQGVLKAIPTDDGKQVLSSHVVSCIYIAFEIAISSFTRDRMFRSAIAFWPKCANVEGP